LETIHFEQRKYPFFKLHWIQVHKFIAFTFSWFQPCFPNGAIACFQTKWSTFDAVWWAETWMDVRWVDLIHWTKIWVP